MPSENIEYLREYGPALNAELPKQITLKDKHAGLAVFKLRGSDQTPMAGGARCVYYLPEHDKSTVIRRFLDVNPGLVESRTRLGFHRLLSTEGRSWVDAAQTVTREFFDEDGSNLPRDPDGPNPRECPWCGETVDGQLPAHLVDGCSE